MIIVAPGVAGNPSARRVGMGIFGGRGGARRRIVIERNDDQAASAFENSPRIGAARIVKIIHLSRISARKPLRQVIEFRERFGQGSSRHIRGSRALPRHGRDTAEIETGGAGPLADPARLLCRRHASMMHQEERTSEDFAAVGSTADRVFCLSPQRGIAYNRGRFEREWRD